MKHFLTLAGCLLLTACLGTGRKSHYDWGVAHYDAGRFDKAAKEFALAAKRGEQARDALFNQALSLYRSGRIEEAILVYEDLITGFGDDVEAYINLARIHAQSGDHEQARTHFEKAINTDILLHEPYSAYAHYLLELNTKEAEIRAWEITEKAVEMGDMSPVAHHFRGIAAHRLGKHEEAKTALERSLQLDGANGEALAILGAYQVERGNHREAAHLLTRATVYKTRDAEIYFHLGTALRHLNRYQEALDSLWRAEGINKDMPGLLKAIEETTSEMLGKRR